MKARIKGISTNIDIKVLKCTIKKIYKLLKYVYLREKTNYD